MESSLTVEVDEAGVRDRGAQGFYLHPGHIFTSSEPATVTTILGSCIAVCRFDVARRLGGLNHYLLPAGKAEGAAATRYAGVANPRLLEELLELGASRGNLRAKLFGGACTIPALRAHHRALGERNITVARDFLEERRIAILAEDVGGRRGRKLVFRTDDGSAWVRKL